MIRKTLLVISLLLLTGDGGVVGADSWIHIRFSL